MDERENIAVTRTGDPEPWTAASLWLSKQRSFTSLLYAGFFQWSNSPRSRIFVPSALGRLHSRLTQQRRGFGRRHELDQFASHILILRHIADGDAEVAVFDKVRRQRAEILGAGDRLDHVGLLDADLDFALSDCDRNRLALDDFDLVLDLVVDAELLEQLSVVR